MNWKDTCDIQLRSIRGVLCGIRCINIDSINIMFHYECHYVTKVNIRVPYTFKRVITEYILNI